MRLLFKGSWTQKCYNMVLFFPLSIISHHCVNISTKKLKGINKVWSCVLSILHFHWNFDAFVFTGPVWRFIYWARRISQYRWCMASELQSLHRNKALVLQNTVSNFCCPLRFLLGLTFCLSDVFPHLDYTAIIKVL